jgi:hypothetical protein
MEQKLRYWYGFNLKIQELKQELRDVEKLKEDMEKQIINDIKKKGMEKCKFKLKNDIVQLNERQITQQISKIYLFEQALKYFNSKQEATQFIDLVYNNRKINSKLYLSKKKNNIKNKK